MTLSLSLPCRLLRAIGLALVCVSPAAYSLAASAAELEGTQVPLDAPHVAPIHIEADHAAAVQHEPAVPLPPGPDVPPPADEPPPPTWNDHNWSNEKQWERNLEKGLSKAFGGDHNDNGFHPALLIPILAILFIFGGPLLLLIMILVFFFGAKRRRQRDINMNIDKLLAAGRDIPVELLRGDEPKGPEESGSLNKGIRNICLGTGWLVFLTILFGIDIGAVGFIWIALGISQVLIWHLNKPREIEQAGSQD